MGTLDVEHALRQPPDLVGDALLEVAEDQWFDRKSFRIDSQKLAECVIGMANADGGFVVVGLSDGRTEGVASNARHLNDLMQCNIDHITPPARCRTEVIDCFDEDEEPSKLLVIEVLPSDVVHATRRDVVFLRVGDETRRLSFVQRRELLFDKGQASYEAELSQATIDGLHRPLVVSYAAAIGASDSVDALRARGLATGDNLSVAGALLFHELPQTYFPEAFMRVLRYRGTERGSGRTQQLLVDERCEGPIPLQIDRARQLVADNQPRRRALLPDGRFGDIPLIPEDVWLEGIVNAAIHRSYSMAGDHIRIEIFDDRIEIRSPGRFPGLVDLSTPLEVQRFARNPRIARVATDLRFGQELGEGIRRMYEEMRAAGLVDPEFIQSSGAVTLTLHTEAADRELEARLPREARSVVAALREAGRLSTGELVGVVGGSRPSVIGKLRVMESAGLIEWHGKSKNDPRAYWSLPPT